MIIVIDTETTSKYPDQAHVVEIGAITEDGRKFSSLCNPGVDLSKCKEALAVNGIPEEDILEALPVQAVAKDFIRWINSFTPVWDPPILAGYNSNNYDSRILEREPWNIPRDWWKYDIMFMAMEEMHSAGALPIHPYYSTPKWPRLSEAEKFFNVKRKGQSHRALSDARATLDIFRKIQKRATCEGCFDADNCDYEILRSENCGCSYYTEG